MRFAGTRMEGFMDTKGPKFGDMAIQDLSNRNRESTTATDLMGKTAATGIQAAGAVEAAGIVGSAQAGLANAQGQAAIMSGIGQIAGSAIGAIPTGGGGYSGQAWNPSGVDAKNAYTNGMDYGGFSATSVLSNPSFKW